MLHRPTLSTIVCLTLQFYRRRKMRYIRALDVLLSFMSQWKLVKRIIVTKVTKVSEINEKCKGKQKMSSLTLPKSKRFLKLSSELFLIAYLAVCYEGHLWSAFVTLPSYVLDSQGSLLGDKFNTSLNKTLHNLFIYSRAPVLIFWHPITLISIKFSAMVSVYCVLK